MKWLHYPLFQPARFKYHHYGPYSRYLSACLHNAVLDGLLAEHADDFGEGYTRYSYTLGACVTPEHVPALEPLYDSIIKRLAGEEWRALELGATVLFLAEEEKKGLDEAMPRALELKADCKPFEAETARLLEYLHEQRKAVPAHSRA